LAELTHNDAIDALRKLPTDKQREVLGRLTPAQRSDIMAKLSAGTAPPAKPKGLIDTVTDAVDQFMAPHEESGTGVVGRLKELARGAVAGIASLPEGLSTGQFQQLRDVLPSYQQTPYGMIPLPNVEGMQHAKEQAQEIKEHPAYSAGSMLGPIVLTEGVSRGAPTLKSAPPLEGELPRGPGTLRRAAQALVGVGPNRIGQLAEDMVGKAGDAAEKVRANNKEATESTLYDRGIVDEKNANAKADAKGKTASELKKVASERRKAIAANREAERAHAEGVEATKAENEKTIDAHRKRAAREHEYHEVSQELDKRVETAEVKAKAENDAAWNQWRDKVADTSVDMTPAVETIKGLRDRMTPEDVSEFRSILRETKPSEADMSDLDRTRSEIMRGQGMTGEYADLPPTQREAVDNVISSIGMDDLEESPSLKEVPATRLHGWKDALEQGVRRAKSGTVRYALGKVLDIVRAKENEASKTAGATEELDKARALHGPYVDAFRNSPNEPATVASKFLTEQSPEFQKEQARQERAARLSAYDPEIGRLANHGANLRKGIEKLPEPVPFREQVKNYPPAPKTVPVPKRPEGGVETPAETHQYAEPHPHLPIERPEFNVRQLREQEIKKLANRLSLSGYDAGILASSALMRPIAAFLGHGTEALFAYGPSLYVGGKIAARTLLQKPEVLDWLARPSQQDIDVINKIPNVNRVKIVDGLTQTAVRAAREGKPVHIDAKSAQFLGPKNIALIAAAVAHKQTPADLKKRAKAVQNDNR
jgi:hypothetical protein